MKSPWNTHLSAVMFTAAYCDKYFHQVLSMALIQQTPTDWYTLQASFNFGNQYKSVNYPHRYAVFILHIKIQWNLPSLCLTHWGRVRHVCVSKLAIIGSDYGLSPDRRQAIIWTNAGLLLIGPLGTNFSKISIEILTFSFKKMHLKLSSAKRRPFCLGLNVLRSLALVYKENQTLPAASPANIHVFMDWLRILEGYTPYTKVLQCLQRYNQ